MTYLFGPDAMKLFFSAPDDQIGFRQVICNSYCSALSNHSSMTPHLPLRQAGHRAFHTESFWAAIPPVLPTSHRPPARPEITAHSCTAP